MACLFCVLGVPEGQHLSRPQRAQHLQVAGLTPHLLHPPYASLSRPPMTRQASRRRGDAWHFLLPADQSDFTQPCAARVQPKGVRATVASWRRQNALGGPQVQELSDAWAPNVHARTGAQLHCLPEATCIQPTLSLLTRTPIPNSNSRSSSASTPTASTCTAVGATSRTTSTSRLRSWSTTWPPTQRSSP